MKKTVVTILMLVLCSALLGCSEDTKDVNSRTPKQEKAYKELFNSNSDSYFEEKSKPVTTNNF
ncbi:hypothetical protein [Halodesulfovibrio aestuarii]|uniref:Lipoprotein n=1 Tax=Halodesulfovibrio aestuarii TaxID=126333 RepID=A0A8G2C9B4_9BACT|nr:hypothetical protein [Halodesulfovibrio aestuarii]SHJ06855.1 hypothetical protein SAMN05660830_01540 [Halodesulfovibrio aestuarii]